MLAGRPLWFALAVASITPTASVTTIAFAAMATDLKRALRSLAVNMTLGCVLVCSYAYASTRPVVMHTQTGYTPAQIEQWRHAYDLETAEITLGAQHLCHPAIWWHAVNTPNVVVLPKTMMVQPVNAGLASWTVVIKPWSFKDVGGYVKGLCFR